MVEKKERKFRGMSVEELQKLDVREFSKLVKSRERRAIMRSFNVIENFIKRSEKKLTNEKMIKTHSRELVIVPQMIGWTIGVYNGTEFQQVKITPEMLGHRLGEFAMTRKPVKHGAAGVGATKSSAALSVK